MFKSRAFTIALAVVILVATLSPPDLSRPPLPINDKLIHFIAFAILVFPRTVLKPRRWPLYAGLAVVLGAGIEIVQPQFGRTAEWADLLADMLGVAFGIGLGLMTRQRVRSADTNTNL